MKIISAVLVLAALLIPKLAVVQRLTRNRHEEEIAKQVLAADLAAVGHPGPGVVTTSGIGTGTMSGSAGPDTVPQAGGAR